MCEGVICNVGGGEVMWGEGVMCEGVLWEKGVIWEE